MSRKQFYGDIVVVERRRIRVDFFASKVPTNSEMLKALNSHAYNDITDEETLDYVSVESVEVDELEDEE